MVATMNNAEAIEIEVHEITHHLVGQTGIVLPLANSLTCKMLLAEFAHRRNKLLVFRCEIEIHDAAPFAVHDGSHQAECSLCAESRRRNKRKAAKEAHQKGPYWVNVSPSTQRRGAWNRITIAEDATTRHRNCAQGEAQAEDRQDRSCPSHAKARSTTGTCDHPRL